MAEYESRTTQSEKSGGSLGGAVKGGFGGLGKGLLWGSIIGAGLSVIVPGAELFGNALNSSVGSAFNIGGAFSALGGLTFEKIGANLGLLLSTSVALNVMIDVVAGVREGWSGSKSMPALEQDGRPQQVARGLAPAVVATPLMARASEPELESSPQQLSRRIQDILKTGPKSMSPAELAARTLAERETSGKTIH